MSETPRQGRSRLQLAFIALVFLGPLGIAAWLYTHGNSPSGRTNHGVLLEPIVNTGAPFNRELRPPAWALLYRNPGECDDACRQALYTTRQARLMLGKEMGRVQRVFLHGASLPDTVFLADEHPGLITIIDSELDALLDNKRPAELPAGGYYLIDPLGNIVMYFRPDLDPSDMVDDIKHLLRLSRIG